MEWNPFSIEAQTDPYPIYNWLRDEAPCYYNEKTDMWALSRFQDVLTTGPMGEVEFGENGLMLTTAGNETTAKLIGNLAYELWLHPEQCAELVADPSRIPGAG